ncbi:MAG: hypothetical protein QXZ40_00335 [Candidatus Micrarchaeia archaeon]
MEAGEAEQIAPEVPEGASEEFLRYSAEVKRLERKALQIKRTMGVDGNVFSEFDIESISVKTYEEALERARRIESGGVKGTGKKEVPEPESILSEEELIRIPKEKIEVVARSEKEILEEERKLKEMKEKFAKLLSEIPKEEPEKPKLLEEAAKKAEEKPVEEGKPEEIKEFSENFKRIMMKKEEREKKERIRKMKKEIEEMLESGEM